MERGREGGGRFNMLQCKITQFNMTSPYNKQERVCPYTLSCLYKGGRVTGVL